MSSNLSFFVTGGTGYQGGSLAHILLAQGYGVHALVRKLRSHKALALKTKGAILFEGSFDDVDVIRSAAKGVAGIFLNPFPQPHDPDLEIRHAKNVIDAAVEERCHLYLSSAVFTSNKEKWETYGPRDFLHIYYSTKYAVEAEVRKADLKSYTIVRPSYLMHNYLLPFCNFHYPELPKLGILKDLYEPGRKFSHLDSADVGRVAAVVLVNQDRYDKLELDIGSQNLDAEDAAAILRKASEGKDIRAEKVVIDGEYDTQTKTGLTWHFFANAQDVTLANGDEVERLFGVRLTTFEEYLHRESSLLEATLSSLS